MESLTHLENVTRDDLKEIDIDLQIILRADVINAKDKKTVTVQFVVDYELIAGIVGWVYAFWTFGKTFFFPDGKFRKPKLLELHRNFKIVLAVLKLKNTLIGLWKDRKNTLDEIGDTLKKLGVQ